jgi:MFS family permease
VIVLGILAGVIAGLVFGGRVDRLLNVRLRWVGLIFLGLALRIGTQAAIAGGVEIADQLRLPLYAGAFGLLIAGLWPNRDHAGIWAVIVGASSNALAIIVNGGYMPVWGPSLEVAGLGPNELNSAFHRLLPETFGPEFFLRAGPIADIIPLPIPILTNVASLGDVFIGAGLAWFVFSTLVRGKEEPAGRISLGRGRASPTQTTGTETASFDRPVVLGGTRGAGAAPPLPLGARIREHPYTRLALDARFASFWLAQTISLFGDRLHQVALAALVYALTASPLLTGLVFLSATLPNLLLGPIAGTFVDRWEHKRVMVASDLIRAALVLAIPFAAVANVWLVYPLVFAITAVSLFFRPAKTAFIPRIVREDDVMAASSATWTADTLADILGFPLAGLFVAALGATPETLGLAFFADSATYVLSALLLVGITVTPIVRDHAPRVGSAVRVFVDELADGWRFLRGQPALFQNTLISVLAQLSTGATLALTIVYASDVLSPDVIGYPQNYAAIETAIGVGNLIGGIAVGALGARTRKGWLIVAGFIVMGMGVTVMGLTGNVLVALVAAFVVGTANLVWIVPTQTLFIEVTPVELLGRVVAFRGSFVFGSMTLAMGIAGILAESVSAGIVIAGFGVLTVLGGVVGAFLPAVRNS